MRNENFVPITGLACTRETFVTSGLAKFLHVRLYTVATRRRESSSVCV